MKFAFCRNKEDDRDEGRGVDDDDDDQDDEEERAGGERIEANIEWSVEHL